MPKRSGIGKEEVKLGFPKKRKTRSASLAKADKTSSGISLWKSYYRTYDTQDGSIKKKKFTFSHKGRPTEKEILEAASEEFARRVEEGWSPDTQIFVGA